MNGRWLAKPGHWAQLYCMGAPRQQRKPTPGQRALAEAMARGEAILGDGVRTLSTDRYVDAARDTEEREQLFGKWPLPICPSALLPRAGMAVPHDLAGKALLLTRDRDGKAHAFANVCRHRASRLLEGDEPVAANRLACPYHAWVYKVDGTLVGVPREETFPGLCKADHGLIEYRTVEAGGLIWVAFDDAADFGDAEALAEDFDAIGIGEKTLFRRATHEVAANWKLVMDAFSESYHVQRLHSGSVGEFFADGITLGDTVGAHQRFLVGRADYAQRIDLDDWTQLRGAMTFTYQLFPNATLVMSPHYSNLLVAWPGDRIDHCRVENFMLVPPDADPDLLRDKWERSWDLLNNHTFGDEDFRAAALCQQGIASGEMPEMLLGALEFGVARFHAAVDKALGRQ